MEWETEARRLAERTEGDPDRIYQGLVNHVGQHDGGTGARSDELRLLANRSATRYRAAWYCGVGYRGHYYWLDTLQSEVADMVGPVPEPEEVGEIFLAAWDARVAEQRNWPETTDNDRLTRAFGALNGDGIVAREDFACCQRCAGGEIFGEFPVDGVPAGFVFFHQQDTLRAALGDTLWLGFGGFSERDDEPGRGHRVRHAPNGDGSHVAVAERTVATLGSEGLTVAWDHTAAQRIAVTLDWKRRIEPH